MSNVTYEKFAERFADELQIHIDVAKKEKLSQIPEYDSMGKINVSLLIEELFDYQIDYDELNSKDTLASLYETLLASV